jgi:putative membrane protein
METQTRLGPCRAHPAWIAIGALRWLRVLGVPLVLALVSGGSVFEQGFYVVAAGFGLLVSLGRLLEWLRFRYEVDGDQLRVRSGLIETQDRLVPLARIQAVDINESLVQRLFGVVGVKIETAAGGSRESDVTLDALRREDATRLRDRLLAARRPPADAGVTDGAGRVEAAAVADRATLVRSLSTRDLLVAGATSAQIGPAAALVVTALELVDGIFGATLAGLLGIERGVTLEGAAALIGLLAAGSWLLAIGGTVLTYAGFELRREDDRLSIAHGLLDRRRRTVPIARIQAVRLEESLLRQPFGLCSLRFDSAGYAREAGGSGVLFPMLPRGQAAALLGAACPDFALSPDGPALARPPARARRRFVLGPVWWVLGLTTLGIVVAGPLPAVAWTWGLLGLIFLPPAALLGLMQYRDSGWAFDDAGRFVVRARAFSRVTSVTHRRRLQRREVSQSPLQRPDHLATFRTAVASGGSGGRLVLRHLDQRVAFDIAHRLGPRRAVLARANGERPPADPPVLPDR